jgi:hypothetical protein
MMGYNDGQFASILQFMIVTFHDIALADIVLVGVGETRGGGNFFR